MITRNVSDEYLMNCKENQYFDRKSAKIKPSDIVRHLVAFDNTNGGILGIGIEDDGKVTGFDYKGAHTINDYLRVIYDIQGNINISSEERIIKGKKFL